jgi:hypothetical protein
MELTVQELENVANATIDFHYKNPAVRSQTLQDKPLLKALEAGKQTIPGNKGEITFGLKGEYTTTLMGFSGDDTVDYQNPANIKRGRTNYKLLHAGIKFTMDELLHNGISITNTTTGEGERRHSERDAVALADILKDKVEDMMEGSDRGHNEMLWDDGTQDAALVAGVTSFILDDPTSATVVLGVDQSANTWWRNRASLLLSAVTPSNLVIINTLQSEWRQLRRYGGRPNLVLCGSDFIEAMEAELRSKGNFTLDGWNSSKATDGGMADISFKGQKFEYDPTLDDMGKAKYCYVMDTRHIKLLVVDGEDGKDHNPARPEDQYVYYRAKTWARGLKCDKRNAQAVYSIA